MRSPIFFRGRELLYYRDHYYPKDEVAAYEFMQQQLNLAVRTQDTKTRVIIVPNGSYRVCGKIMADAYAKLCPEPIKRIFVFGRAEQFMPYKCGLSNTDYLDTPLGKLPIDKEVNNELFKTGEFILLDPPYDSKERSIEMQLPFIAKIMENFTGRFKVIPVYIGVLERDQQRTIARRFQQFLKDPGNVFIFSASLCHWGEIYGMKTQMPDKRTVIDSIKAADNIAVEALKQIRFKPFEEYMLDTKSKVLDYQVFNVCIWLVRQFLDEDHYALTQMDDETALKAMQQTATFTLVGQAWSYPDVTPSDSCISYISATISLDKERYVPEEPEPPDPLSKLC
ncbi:unnamed protein product [Calicophoron daubneyi]|uniref:Uncharacterized protein n=1 Tax=Calicophoron daubneyi TaxID=300641 RepID=A0AAV2TR59_CALDB